MIKTKKNKFNKIFFLLLFFISFFLVKPLGINAQSSDAIAVRIVENPLHYSSLRWYQSQNFAGSPQLIEVDGYDAVRNGRTVYINAANIIDQNGDGVPDFLFTNIYIISYNQDVQGATIDIFGQLLKNFKLNTNLTDPGVCNKSTATLCLTDDKCPTGEYCQSKKAKVIRDVKRLADMEEIKSQLDIYKKNNSNSYPSVKAGTYIANKTISTWPSWQQNLGQELGASLPLDPINQLGACPGYDPLTCWDKDNKKFATDLSKLELPQGSHIYMYVGDNQGKTVKYCAQMESGFSNLSAFNCFNDSKGNRAPVINDVNLFGQHDEEFTGFVKVSDPDGDSLKLTIDLVNPSSDIWTSRRWKWDTGFNKFSVISTPDINQKKIHAVSTGGVALPGYYKVRLTVDDGQGAANSIYSHDYDLTVNSSPMALGKAAKSVVIGNSDILTMNGSDGSGDPFSGLSFKSASFNNSPIDENTLKNDGFVLSGNSLSETFKSIQLTGDYIVNVYAIDPMIPTNRIDSFFDYTITNNPPVFKNLTATFANNTTQNCSQTDTPCTIPIDNAEAATVKINGSDPDGHQVSYSLVDNYGGKLIINSSTGVISGFEKLNFHLLSDQTFNVSVKISDQYCKNSSDAECSSIYSFNVLVQKYCSADLPASTSQVNLAGPFKVNKTGDALETGFDLSDCSAVGTSSIDVRFVGESHSQAIVLVSDLSTSMDTNVGTSSAISQLKKALAADSTGFLDRLYNIISAWSGEYTAQVALVAYNSTTTDSQSLKDLSFPNRLTYLKDRINRFYTTGPGTNTLAGLNKAEDFLSTVPDNTGVEKIIILMSDGIPGINGQKDFFYCPTIPCKCTSNCGCTLDSSGTCYYQPSCNNKETFSQYADGTCSNCYEPDEVCYCGKDAKGKCIGYSNFCTDSNQRVIINWNDLSCSCVDRQCTDRSCYVSTTPTSVYPDCQSTLPNKCSNGYDYNTCGCQKDSAFNNLLDKFLALFNFLKPNSAFATTNQTQCKTNYPNYIGTTTCRTKDSLFFPKDQTVQWSYTNVIDCDISADVDTEATFLKKNGVSIYTIYYNTSASSTPAVNMCNWSSSVVKDCTDNTYAFAGTDISSMIDKVLGRVVTKPKDVKVGTSQITDSDMATTTSFVSGATIGSLSCGPIRPTIKYSNSGYLEFSNLKLNYCTKKLHS